MSLSASRRLRFLVLGLCLLPLLFWAWGCSASAFPSDLDGAGVVEALEYYPPTLFLYLVLYGILFCGRGVLEGELDLSFDFSEECKEDIVGVLVGGFVLGFVGVLVWEFVWVLVLGFIGGLVLGLIWGFVGGLVLGLVWGLVGGLVLGALFGLVGWLVGVLVFCFPALLAHTSPLAWLTIGITAFIILSKKKEVDNG